MNKVSIQLSVFAVLAVFVSSAMGQARDPFDAHCANIRILQLKKVQQAVGVSEGQRKQMNVAADANNAAVQAIIKKNSKKPDQKAIGQAMRSLAEKVLGILSPPQLKRLREISLQEAGLAALMDPEVGARVGIAKAQEDSIRAILVQDRKDINNLETATAKPIYDKYSKLQPKTLPEKEKLASKARQEMSAAITKARPSLDKIVLRDRAKILALLTPKQKAAWDALKGKPFVLQ